MCSTRFVNRLNYDSIILKNSQTVSIDKIFWPADIKFVFGYRGAEINVIILRKVKNDQSYVTSIIF